MERLRLALLAALVPLHACGSDPRPASIDFVVPDSPIPRQDDRALVEPRPAINPWNPDHMAIAAIAASPAGRDSGWTCVVVSTIDGGATWGHADLGIDRCIDPWIEFTAPEALVATAIEIRRDTVGEGRLGLLSFRSSDGGGSWAGEGEVVPGFEHPILAPDGDSAVLLVGRRMSRSGADDVRHDVFVGRARAREGGFARLSESRPAGTGQPLTEITPTGLARTSDGALVVSVLGVGEAWALRSRDGGRSFETASPITAGCAGGDEETEFAGWPALAQAAGQDRLFHACVRPGLDGIEVRHSTDGGATWSPGVVLGADLERPVAAAPSGPPHARTPMVAANAEGAVAVAWYDRRLDPDSACQDILFTASRDGGESFEPPVRVSTETSCPRGGTNDWVADSWPMGGDYGSLIARPDGNFLLVWSDSRSGRFALRYAVVRVS